MKKVSLEVPDDLMRKISKWLEEHPDYDIHKLFLIAVKDYLADHSTNMKK